MTATNAVLFVLAAIVGGYWLIATFPYWLYALVGLMAAVMVYHLSRVVDHPEFRDH